MHTVSPQVEQKFISTYDQAINEGMLKGMQKGREEGILQGMQKGQKKAMQETAKRLQKMGFDIQVIESITGLSNTEIQTIIKE